MRKKWIALFLFCALTLSLCACGDDTGEEQTENGDQNGQTQANDRTETEETGITRSPKTGDTQEFFRNILVLMFAAGAAAVWAFLQKKKKYH